MQLFSQKERLEKMRFFGNQDSGVEITSPSVWIAIIGAILLIAALAVWSVIGVIPQSQSVEGVYIGDGKCVFFADPGKDKNINAGMTVRVSPATSAQEADVSLVGEITEESDYISDMDEVEELLHSDSLAAWFLEDGPAYYLLCELTEDADTASGFAWTSDKGDDITLKPGTFVTGTIHTGDIHPISLFFS